MLDPDKVLEHYSRDFVVEEILEYSRMRWVALEVKPGNGRTFFRYWWRNGPPLSFPDRSSFERLVKRYVKLYPRAFYASVNLYQSLTKREDFDLLDNIIGATPIWDVDGSLSNVKLTLDAAKVIVDELERHGLSKSVYLKWSGRGLHIHVNEKAFSKELVGKFHPLDIAYSTVEFILRKTWDEIGSLAKDAGSLERPFRVENKIDVQRVFTAPLSFHRELDLVSVCFKPDRVHEFDLSWADPQSFKHDKGWREYVSGEGDELARKAIEEVGGYFGKFGKRTGESKVKQVVVEAAKVTIEPGKIGRFQVMALLQAARHYLLKGDLERAKSFGLNRAIFYAWAKHSRSMQVRQRSSSLTPYMLKSEVLKFEKIGDEEAPITESGWFVFGNVVQTPIEFDRQIAQKIEAIVSFEIAWNTTLDYLRRFPRAVLESRSEFFKKVYEPVRDSFMNLIQESASKSEQQGTKT